MKKKKDEFNGLVKNYLHEDILLDLVEAGIDVDRYVANIKSIRKGQDYKVVGYGSLLKKSDAKRTFSKMKSTRVGYVKNYQRIFNMGNTQTGSYLNVEFVKDNILPVALITITAEDMFGFYYRESRYETIDVDVYPSDNCLPNAFTVKAKMVTIKDAMYINPVIEPMLTYTLLCIEGAKELFGSKDFKVFMDETMTNHSNLRYWLKTLNVYNYALSTKHTSR